MAAFPYMEAVVGFMILMYIFETYLDLRQHAALKLPTLPKTLEGVISQDKFEKSRAYSIDKSNFHFVHEFVTIVMDSAILLFGVLPWFWTKSGGILESFGLDAENEIYHTLAFLAGVMIWSQITDLPFSLYSTFVIEERHGFNKQTFWLFIRDMIKGMILAVVIGPPVVAAIILIVQKGGPYLAIYLWGFMFVLSLVMMTIYPVLIAPLFNKFTPLPEGELRTKIETLASSLNFPLKKLFVVDGSTRSSHSNAYMYGFFKNKRIVLYDTLIQQCKNVEEVVAVIAHELGHWKLNHTMYSFIAVQVLTLLQFGGYTLVKNSKDLFLSFGFDTQPVLIGLILFQAVRARAGVNELRKISCKRRWNLVEIDAELSKLTLETKQVMSLINPSNTYMDLNIGIALWLAASGDGWLSEEIDVKNNPEHQHVKYKSDSRILLVGSGADEQCAGYGRHRTKFRQSSWAGLNEEMKLDMQRIWKRNLGRDDRCIADNGKEARFPFLDEDVISLLLDIPLWEIADLRQPSGVGDKKILREVARMLQLHEAAVLPKRAIQFGSRIARESNRKNFGSNRAANQASAGSAFFNPN